MMMIVKHSNLLKSGFTLVEAIVGTALVLIVFMGIFGAYRLGLKVIWLNKTKVVAASIANARIELMRGLPYESVGLKNAVLPNALGDLDPVVSKMVNGTTYTTTTSIIYVIDPADGIGSGDPCNLDYKKAEAKVSWNGNYPGEIIFSTNIAPKSQAQETQTCLSQPGGILTVRVSDSSGMMVAAPEIEIYALPGVNLADSKTPTDGAYSFALPIGLYRIMVSKDGYSSIRTYGSDEVANPNDPDLMVFNGGATEKSLSIDLTSALSIDGISPSGLGEFSDSFEDQSKVSELTGAEIGGGSLSLVRSGSYSGSGSAISAEIFPGDLVGWGEFSFDDSRPDLTGISYQILYFDSLNWVPVPDACIGGNSAGLNNSPIQLSGTPIADYPKLKIKANLFSNDSAATPKINNWKITWESSTGVPFANAAFHLRGQKTIGKDSGNNNVYKYSQDLALDAAGHLDLAEMESDLYDFSTSPASTISLIGVDPALPVNAVSGLNTEVKLYLRAVNSLLLGVDDQDTLKPVFGASVRLFNPLIGFDSTRNTAVNGQVYFAPLQNGTYNMEIIVPGYETYSGSVLISGQTAKSVDINMED